MPIVLIHLVQVAIAWLAALAYPPYPNGNDPDRRKREQFAEALRTSAVRQLPVAERPHGLPRGRVVERRMRMGLHRIKTGALPAAWMLRCAMEDRAQTHDDWSSSAPTYAAERLQSLIDAELMKRGLRSTPRDPEQRANVLHRIWKRHRCVLHLALPLLDRLRSKSLSDLLSDLDWVVPAWHEAEVWRCVISQRYPRIRADELVPMCHFLKSGRRLCCVPHGSQPDHEERMVELISRREGRRQACVSRTTEFRLIHHDPTWPQPVDILPGGKTGYVAAEIEAWIRKRIAARDEKVSERAPAGSQSEPVGSSYGEPAVARRRSTSTPAERN